MSPAGIARAALLLLAVFSTLSFGFGPCVCQAVAESGSGHEGRFELCFVGNTAVSSSRLRSACASLSGLSQQETLERVELTVLQAYRETGYLEASVESTSVERTGKGKKLVVHIHEGEPVRISSFKFVGNRRLSSDELHGVCDLRTGTILCGALLEGALEKLVDYMADEGLPFASAKVGDFVLRDRGVSFAFIIDEGPLCTVDDVRLENSSALTSKSLERALGITSGERYCEKKLRNGLNSLRRTALFVEVGEPVVSASGENTVRIAVPVRDRKTTSFAGAVGFRGRTNELTGGVSLSLLNIARTGRSAKAGWEAMGGNVSSFNLSYAEPWVMGLPFSSSVSLEHVVRDTFFARTSVTLLCKVPLSSYVSAELGTSFEKALNTDGPSSRTSRVAWLGGIGVAAGAPPWSTANSFLAALRGSRGTKKTTLVSGEELRREVFSTLTGRTLLQRRLGRSQIALVDMKASAILEGREFATPDELFALGGKKTLRGYAERQFLAPTVGSVQVEYGVIVGGEGGRAFAFVDCGYACTETLSTRERFHVGYGIGLKVPSPFGVAGIDFGIPAGESLSSGKVHVGLEGAF